MKQSTMIRLALLVVMSLLLSSCSAIGFLNPSSTSATADPTGSTGPDPSPLPEDGDLMADIVPAAWTAPADTDPELAASMMRFADELLLSSLDNDQNVLISPASVFLALAMTMNGADKATRDAMIRVLTGAGFTADAINNFSRGWIQHLTSSGGEKTAISIANSIWFREGFDADPDFLQTNADFFGAGARSLDFADPASLEIINDWVDANTNGLIRKIIEKINPTTIMYLVNTVYFKSDWQQPFLWQDTISGNFQTDQGDVTHDFMNQTTLFPYFAISGGQGVVLPYDNGRYAYVAILPDAGTDPRAWLSAREPGEISSQIFAKAAQAESAVVQLSLPKYEAAYEDTLNDELMKMGMEIAFDGGSADFSLMNQERRTGLYISEVRHKTTIIVDEEGTEAAAATSVAIDESAMMTEHELVFNRPFIYTIIDLENGLPLFTGILDHPAG
ncbi:MAG: serpin family protein [Eubacteriales bacterium]|nr:serpin family protein [Eubacteriales bacterium]MDD3867386.1 serpin family protein [Eubacteriales bacterium]MDD4461917.1 serpin family protein [Eubacteriales bacterium]